MSSISALTGAFFVCVLFHLFMATTVDFQLINRVDGSDLSVVMPMNQDAFDFLSDEWYIDCLPNGKALVDAELVKPLVDDIEHAQMVVAAV